MKQLTSVAGLAWLSTVHLAGASDDVLRRLERLLRVVHDEARAAVVKARAAADPIAMGLTALMGVGPCWR